MGVTLIARPIGDDWPGELTPDDERKFSRFDASWSATVDLLCREVEMLGGDEVVLQLAISERDCRNDGWIRADARPAHPGAIVSFESRHGPLRYSTDRFKGTGYGGRLPSWQANVRAIALGLEALRTVDRYGIGHGGEQYRGWNALPPATPMGAAMTAETAAQILIDVTDAWDLQAPEVIGNADLIQQLYRSAAAATHPDRGGDPAEFRRVTDARDILMETT